MRFYLCIVVIFLSLNIVSAQKLIKLPELGFQLSLPAKTEHNQLEENEHYWCYYPSRKSSLEVSIEITPKSKINPLNFDENNDIQVPLYEYDTLAIQGIEHVRVIQEYFCCDPSFVSRYYFELPNPQYILKIHFEGGIYRQGPEGYELIDEVFKTIAFFPVKK